MNSVILTDEAQTYALNQLGQWLKKELNRPDWEIAVDLPKGDGGTDVDGYLYLYPTSWRIPGTEEYVALSFYWPNIAGPKDGLPAVQLYVPYKKDFPQRDLLLGQVKDKLTKLGFETSKGFEYFFWKELEMEFNEQTGIPFPVFSDVLNSFKELLAFEEVIEKVMASQPPEPPAHKRRGKIVSIVDTEFTPKKLTELAIINVVYDPVGDTISPILGEYYMGRGKELDTVLALDQLRRADAIVAHNGGNDRARLAALLRRMPTNNWLDSCKGIEWKGLLGIDDTRQETIANELRIEISQKHTAKSDAENLLEILATKQDGRTYLNRLLVGGYYMGEMSKSAKA